MLGRVKQVAPHVTTGEALVKLAIVLTIAVPVPIVVCALAGFWLDYYKFSTLPLFTAIGVVIGTVVAFLGVVQTIVFGHQEIKPGGGGRE